jgi:hypothetical protein
VTYREVSERVGLPPPDSRGYSRGYEGDYGYGGSRDSYHMGDGRRDGYGSGYR